MKTGISNGQIGNVQDYLTISLGQASMESRESLADVKDRIDTNNDRRRMLRELRSAARTGDEGAVDAVLNKPGNEWLAEQPELMAARDDITSEDGFEKFESAIDDTSNTLGDINSTLAFELQVQASRVTQAETVQSTILKKFNDSASGIINNI